MPTFTFEQVAAVAAKVETTRGVAIAITGTTDGFRTYNSPINSRSTFERREIRSHSTAFTKGLDIIGIRQNQPQFNFVMMGSGGTAITPPRWGAILRCAGYIQTVGASSVTYEPPADQTEVVALPTATIETEMDGTLKRHVGTQAESFTITAEAGGPWTAAFRGRGVYAGTTLGSITGGWGGGTDVSRPWLSPTAPGTACSITPNGRAVHVPVAHAMNYDVGIRLVPVTDANTSDGLNSTWVVDQNPTLDLTIAYDKIASGTLQISQIESDLTSSNVHGITLENGGSTSAGQRVQLGLPTAQLVEFEPLTGNGLRRARLRYKVQHATVGSEQTFTTL